MTRETGRLNISLLGFERALETNPSSLQSFYGHVDIDPQIALLPVGQTHTNAKAST